MQAKNLTEWRKLVLERDNYICQICSEKCSIADHIISRTRNPSLVLETDNGRTLCRKCHLKYGDRYIAKATLGDKFTSRINQVGRDRSTYTVTIPRKILRSIVEMKNLDILNFRNTHQAIVYYGNTFDGAFIRFEERKPEEE